MSADSAPGRREGILFPILLPIVVIVLVVGAIVGLGTSLLSVAAVEKFNAVWVALAFAIVIMALSSFVYVLGERRARE
jgi:uncharacterized membrane protein YczE